MTKATLLSPSAVMTHAVADGGARALCGVASAGGWGRLHPVHGHSNVTCLSCQAALAQRYMAAVSLPAGRAP